MSTRLTIANKRYFKAKRRQASHQLNIYAYIELRMAMSQSISSLTMPRPPAHHTLLDTRPSNIDSKFIINLSIGADAGVA